MLDDDAGRLIESLDQFPRRIGVADVVIAQLFALQLRVVGNAARHRNKITVKRRVLVRILPVAHILHLGKVEIDLRRERALAAVRIDRGEVVADCRVVGCGVRISLLRQIETGRVAHRTAVNLHLGQHIAVVRRIGDDGNMGVVLRRRTHHGRPADVDVLDSVFQ